MEMFLGLYTLIYPAADLQKSKQWFEKILGKSPYFDQPFYVGFDVGGYELGLDPDASPDDGPTTYLGVKDIEEAVANLKEAGAEVYKPIRLVGEGIQVATMKTPEGYLLGLIENPHFQAAAQKPAAEDKPHF